MAVDRGGLQYTIAIRDQFSKTTAKFRKELESAKASFKDLQAAAATQRTSAESFKKNAAAIDENKAALQRLAAESKRQRDVEKQAVAIRNAQTRDSRANAAQQAAAARDQARAAAEQQRAEQQALRANVQAKTSAEREAAKIAKAARADEAAALTQQQRDVKAAADAKTRTEREAAKISASLRKDEQAQLQAFADNQAATEKEAAKIAAAQARDARARQAQDPNFIAQQRINDGLREEAIVRAQITQLRARGAQQIAGGDLLGGARTINEAKALKEQLNQVESGAGRALFTFRRLVGILAVFTIARETVEGFQSLVSRALAFNTAIESARVSVAGLIVATSEVRDQFGRPASGVQAFSIALGIADQQVRQLQKDAIALGVPFDHLVETFQIAVAPGFGAGLKIDEIRKLTGSISAAAKAIGLPQNQLAEEIRSLLSGTIQARTTRIATALGITNADVQRLKQTGQFVDFLSKRFEAFTEAAQRQARSTLSGLREVTQGIINQILGEAARPLFDALISVGNELIDKFLTIKDAAGKVTINPQVVQAFRAIFVALDQGVAALRDAFKDIGIQGLANTLQAVGTILSTALQFAIGFTETLVKLVSTLVNVFSFLGQQIGLTATGFGKIAGALGTALALTIAWNNTLGLTGLKVGTIVDFFTTMIASKFPAFLSGLKGFAAEAGIIAAIFAGALLVFDGILKSVFDVNLSLVDTVKLIGLGLVGGLEKALTGLKLLGNQFRGAFSFETQEEIDAKKQDILNKDKERQLALDKEIADVVAKANDLSVRGPGFDPLAKAKKGAADFQGLLSGVGRQVKELDALMKQLDDDAFKTGREFSAAFNSKDVTGAAQQIQSIFSESFVKSAVDLKKIRTDQARVEKDIADIIKGQNVTAERRQQLESVASGNLDDKAVKALKISEAEAQLVSLFQDEKEINEALSTLDEKRLNDAIKKASIVAVGASRELAHENALLAQQAEAEQAISDVVVNRLGARRRAVVEAQNALAQQQIQDAQEQEALQRNIDLVKEKLALTLRTGEGGPSAAERNSQIALLTTLQQRLKLEKDISDAKERQLEFQLKQAQLAAEGTIGAGAEAGFRQLAEELPNAFEAGIAIVKQSTQQLVDFISTSIVAAFDPTQDQSLQERFARFLQGIANIILQQIISLAIQSALQNILETTSAGAVQVASATTAAGITVDASVIAAANTVAAAQAAAAIQAAASLGGIPFHEGGLVPSGFARGGLVGGAVRSASAAARAVQGLAIGGLPRPDGIHPSDTIPAWLSPGEFVVRRAVVDSLGLGFMNRLNAGGLPAPGSAPSGEGAGQAAGMARGGLVTDRAERKSVAERRGSDGVTFVPVQVAGEKEFDRMQAGGKNAFIKQFRENAPTLRAILQGGK